VAFSVRHGLHNVLAERAAEVIEAVRDFISPDAASTQWLRP
jgi:hypothetical protein